MGLIRMGPPEELIMQLVSEFAIKNFIETGTYEGGTALWASKFFQTVFTIEMSEYYYKKVSAKYSHFENVKFIVGDSRIELKKIINELKGTAIFWLDAHWSGGATYGNSDQCPILEEIEIINNCPYDSLIFIDDARLFTSPPQQPHIPEQWANIVSLFKTLQAKQEDKYIVIIEDVIIAVPLFAARTVTKYCQNTNARLWAEYGRQHNKSNLRKAAELMYTDLSVLLKKPYGIARRIYHFAKRRLQNR